jgi:murein DD-endopeptidase MepM/ murein hydrolase activator NlpD
MRLRSILMKRNRRTTLVVVLVLVALFGSLPSAAFGAKPSVVELRAKLAALRQEAKKAGDAYSKAYWRLDKTKLELAATNKDVAQSEEELVEATARLSNHVAIMYRQGDIDYLALLLTSDTLDDMLVKLEYVTRIGLLQANAVGDVEKLRTDLLAEKTRLEALESERLKEADSLKKRAQALDSRLKSVQSEYEKVQAQLLAAVARQSGGTSSKTTTSSARYPAGPNGMVFPVQGPCYYSDSWGAARSGGRTHKGTDIMARTGVPCVAVLGGTVRTKTSSLGGMTIWLRADNGWAFYYAHLSRYAVTSGRVSAGQVIGYVGSTGNASASAPHLHFEIHPGGGAAVNPYQYLRAME